MAILITGANRGIGAALLSAYKSNGRAVRGTSRDSSVDYRVDVTNSDDLNALADRFREKPIDLLICNAGVYLDKGMQLEDLSADMWAATFAVNVTGVAETIRHLLPSLTLVQSPKVAIISSQMASQELAPGGSYIYRASKAAALNLGRNLATDLKSQGIAVGIYHPGWVQTDMGGAEASIDAETAAAGLIDRFDHLSLDTTGCFETWDGRPHPL